MGTTLTGTTPQDTYDSLIKVTDNGPLTGSLKKLTDGLGNDSSLSLSTTAASLSGTLAVTGAATLSSAITSSGIASLGIGQTTELAYIGDRTTVNTRYIKFERASALTDIVNIQGVNGGVGSANIALQAGGGNVGIGTTAPNFILETAGTTGIGVRSEGVDGVYSDILSSVYSGNANEQNAIQASVSGVAGNSGFRFQVSNGSGLTTQTLGYQLNKDRHVFYANGTERVRITTDGLTFNGDTAAANALDDYEEGTWTMGVSFGGASVGMTFVNNEGRYTKIGRQVTAGGYMAFSNKGSSTGDAKLTGLPFTSGAFAAGITPVTLRLENITFTNAFQGYLDTSRTSIDLGEVTILGVASNLTNADFSNGSVIMVSVTYTV
jgi:hypothetical protein